MRTVVSWVASGGDGRLVTSSHAIKPADLAAVADLLGLPTAGRARAMAHIPALAHVWDVALASDLLAIGSGRVRVTEVGNAWLDPIASDASRVAAGRAVLEGCLEVAGHELTAEHGSWRPGWGSPVSPTQSSQEVAAAALVQACRGGVVVRPPGRSLFYGSTVQTLRERLYRFLQRLVADGVAREQAVTCFEVAPPLMPVVVGYAVRTRAGRWTVLEEAELWREEARHAACAFVDEERAFA